MGRLFGPLVVLALAVSAVGCSVLGEEEKLGDGARCANNEECGSGVCTTDELCAPSSCDCGGDTCQSGGERSGDCADGRVCVTSTSLVEDFGMFFSMENDNDGYCQLPCGAGCPEHHLCSSDFCVPERGWADPVPTVTWSGATTGMLTGKDAIQMVPLERGQPVTLQATATSATNSEINSFAWNLVDESGVPVASMGETVELMIAPEGSFHRAELTVTDAKMRSSMLQVIFEGCTGSGEQCGYEGRGCCNDCDRATNVCN
jgi:hypothetical protein